MNTDKVLVALVCLLAAWCFVHDKRNDEMHDELVTNINAVAQNTIIAQKAIIEMLKRERNAGYVGDIAPGWQQLPDGRWFAPAIGSVTNRNILEAQFAPRQ